MTDKVLCPYCGAEMKSSGWVSLINGNLAYTVCSNNRCKSAGPYVRGYETMDEARAAALSAAQARYLPPNRPLTLEEVNALDADEVGDIPCFVEIAPYWYEQDPDDFDPRLRADVMCKDALDCATYNNHFRVWLRKPTKAEMDAAGWGGGANND